MPNTTLQPFCMPFSRARTWPHVPFIFVFSFIFAFFGLPPSARKDEPGSNKVRRHHKSQLLSKSSSRSRCVRVTPLFSLRWMKQKFLFIQHFATSNDLFDRGIAQNIEHWICFPFCCHLFRLLAGCAAIVCYAHAPALYTLLFFGWHQERSSSQRSVSIYCINTASIPHALYTVDTKGDRRRQISSTQNRHRPTRYRFCRSSSTVDDVVIIITPGPNQLNSIDTRKKKLK